MIRPATFEDIPVLVSIGSLFHSQTILDELLPYDSGSVRHLLEASIEKPECTVIVLELEGEVIGGIVGAVSPVYWNQSLLVGQQFAWFVRNSKRRGMASVKLLEAFEKWAFENGAVAVFSGAKNDANREGMDKLLSRKGYFNLESVYLKGGESCQHYQ